jgi:acetyl-CoA decarbonylase/synthase complex subunit gamma
MTRASIAHSELKMFDPAANRPSSSRLDSVEPPILPSLKQSFLTGSHPTAAGKVPKVSYQLTWADRIGACKARWGIGRMKYGVEPGLYALGNPDKETPVLATANYKMSFDRLRQSLPGRNAWILVLDTRGINVWCAAGKGIFGTAELVHRIEVSGVKKVVSHRELILPQLAAPGVTAHLVKRLSGFKVTYGPIRAEDLPAFLDSGMDALPELRTKTFSFRERAALVPVELVGALKGTAVLLAMLFILSGFLARGGFWSGAMAHLIFIPAVLAAVFAGAVLTPLLLPWLPGRAFSLKGLPVGLAFSATIALLQAPRMGTMGGLTETASWMILIPAMATYLAMNFTGASTYTSLSGVRAEMRLALPIQAGAGVIGLGLWIFSLLA